MSGPCPECGREARIVNGLCANCGVLRDPGGAPSLSPRYSRGPSLGDDLLGWVIWLPGVGTFVTGIVLGSEETAIAGAVLFAVSAVAFRSLRDD